LLSSVACFKALLHLIAKNASKIFSRVREESNSSSKVELSQTSVIRCAFDEDMTPSDKTLMIR
jgi:hypothetical protein